MTRFLSVRSAPRAGQVVAAQALDSDGAMPLRYRMIAPQQVARDVAGRQAILAIHGFNVSQADGVAAFTRLEHYLALAPHQQFFGVLWPGDFWIPAVNYPWEASDAVRSGIALAAYLNQVFPAAASISLISHSLGARVVLAAVRALTLPVDQLCLTAAAVDADCLLGQYDDIPAKVKRITVLSSLDDVVLRLAYPAGDAISDVLLGDDDSPWQSALGRAGPRPRPAAPPLFSDAIPTKAGPGIPAFGYGHHNYLPSGPDAPPPPVPKWAFAADYMRRAITGQPARWG